MNAKIAKINSTRKFVGLQYSLKMSNVPLCYHPCSLNQWDESIASIGQGDKSQCTIPNILPAYNFSKQV